MQLEHMLTNSKLLPFLEQEKRDSVFEQIKQGVMENLGYIQARNIEQVMEFLSSIESTQFLSNTIIKNYFDKFIKISVVKQKSYSIMVC